jgi:hypothetical protein
VSFIEQPDATRLLFYLEGKDLIAVGRVVSTFVLAAALCWATSRSAVVA